jgi:SAM-dependent methyltransferase
MKFRDYFSSDAADYAQYRPRYPAALFEYLASLPPDRALAWDCATGNGQAARGLADFFKQIIATDGSEKQIANAERDDRISYRVATAEESGLESRSVDLISVAQALHWFPIKEFFDEARRVLKPNGVLAVWCYNLLEISPPIDQLIANFYRETVGPHWDFDRKLVETGYRTIPFPFNELVVPKFYMEANWSLTHLLGYLRTWSATKKFMAAQGSDPVVALAAELALVWGEPDDTRPVSWPLSLRVGRCS